MKKLTILIVNFNGKDILNNCLKSLLRQKYKDFGILVVDNNSEDGSLNLLAAKYPKVKIVKSSKNLGYAGGNNLGIKSINSKYILLLNNDTIMPANTLNGLVEYMEDHPDVGVVQPKVILKESGRLQAGGAFLTVSGFLYHYGFGKNPKLKKYQKEIDIFSANGSCMMLRKKVVDKVGLFDNRFFAYFEETDFCWRVWLSGSRVVYYPKVLVYHIGGVTSAKLSSSFVMLHSYKNRIASLIKNLSLEKIFYMLPMHIFMIEISSIMFLIFRRPAMILVIQKAIWWNIVNINSTLKERRKVRKMIKVAEDKLMKRMIKDVRLSYYYYLFTGLDKYKDAAI